MERENKIVKGIIYCKELKTGVEQFKKLIEDYSHSGISCKKAKINGNQIFADFDNGDNWIVTRVNNGLGKRCNIAYIDRNINDEDIDKIIMPTITLPPYQAYSYYSWGNW